MTRGCGTLAVSGPEREAWMWVCGGIPVRDVLASELGTVCSHGSERTPVPAGAPCGCV